MRNTHPISITLPHDMAAMVKAKVASGEYATESEVIRDGLRALQARDAAVEKWLRDEVAKSYDEYAADPVAAFRSMRSWHVCAPLTARGWQDPKADEALHRHLYAARGTPAQHPLCAHRR